MGEREPTEYYRRVDISSITLKKVARLADSITRLSKCPYCKGKLKSDKLKISPELGFRRYDYYATFLGRKCLRCNWWYIQKQVTLDSDETDVLTHALSTYEGIICHFEEAPWIEAIRHTEEELVEYRKSLISLKPEEVERLVGEILCQYHECDVRHVGRSHDKGIDLIVIKGDTNIAVQVKHRIGSGKVESVSPVREFVGALVAERFTKGLFVSTAASFSKYAREYAAQVNRNFVPLNLIDIHELREMIRNISANQWSVYDKIWNYSGWDRI